MPKNQQPHPQCLLEFYTPGWKMGSGIPISLAPGTYRITHQSQVAGVTYWDLEGMYRIDSRRVEQAKKAG